VPYVRTVKTASGATAVQIVYSSHRGSRDIEHLGSAHNGAELELLKAAARQRLAAGQGELDLGLAVGAPGGPLPITSSRMGHLHDALSRAYDVLGFGRAAGGDEVFRLLALARIIEPTSKRDALRVLEEAGLAPPSYATLNRRLPEYARQAWRQKLSAACAGHARLGGASLVLYDVSTLYFETDAGDGFREPGFSKERRLDPQITIGLLTGQAGFPLMVSAFEGNEAETMLPVIEALMAAHDLPDVTVVADAGMVSEANQKEIEAAGLSFILGKRIPDVPYVVAQWHRDHPGENIPDGHVFTQPWPAGPNGGRRDQVIYYQYRHHRARRTLRGIDEQVAKAEKAVAGQVPVKRNRFIQLSGGAAGSRTRRAGQSGNSSAPPAATAPSKSIPATTPSPPPIPCPPTSVRPSTASTAITRKRTELSKLRLTLGSDPARSQAGPPACYRASWQLPGPDFHRQAATSLRTRRNTMALRQVSPPVLLGARKGLSEDRR
jgi:hypothetical protein